MANGRSLLAFGALSALATANATKSLDRKGPGSVLSFATGLPMSELPLPAMAFQAGVATALVARGAHRTNAGKLGLTLTGASIAGLARVHEAAQAAPSILEAALVDELGADYRERTAAAPMHPRSGTARRVVPSPRWRKSYVADGHISYGEHGRRNTLDIWKRADLSPDAKAPVLVQVHGGAWVTGDKENQAYPLMAYLAERGWIVVAVTYRLSPRATWPDHIVDVKRALAWVRSNIASHGGDPDWIAITGGSAGGHLCSLAALTPNDPSFQPGFEDQDTSVRAAVPFYGVYDWTNRDGSGRADIDSFLEKRVVKTPRAGDGDIWDLASPMTYVGPDAPPMFFLHGSEDSLVPVEQARSMVEMLRKESNNPVVYAELPGAQHAFDIFGSVRGTASAMAVARFLEFVRGG